MTVRFAALGDSLTEGVGDPVPGGWRGWAALLAPSLSPDAVEFRNLADSGSLSRDLLVSQLPTALAFRPRYAAVVVGGNDTLRASFDLELTARHFAAALSSLTSAGAVPLTACLPDPGRLLGLPAPLARPLARRMRGVNAVVHGLSEHYGAVHQHLADLPWTQDRSLLSVDRLHPSAAGHQLIARGFHALLAEAGHPVGAAPEELAVRAPRPGADLWWMLTRGTRWVAARSTDLLPGLVALAALEARHLLRGSTRRLDRDEARATAEIVARLTATEARPAPTPAASGTPAAGPAPDTGTGTASQTAAHGGR
ncbi:SGNH/GDSL hydrolase family protein [Kitasatospora sp. NPDC088134]|uniref:SGNH/GDSL hydrolase family protein n=1 Tax=Kitasatospora sp. NPDC088134 TaxID=3364071 RepID=UPI0038081F19